MCVLVEDVAESMVSAAGGPVAWSPSSMIGCGAGAARGRSGPPSRPRGSLISQSVRAAASVPAATRAMTGERRARWPVTHSASPWRSSSEATSRALWSCPVGGSSSGPRSHAGGQVTRRPSSCRGRRNTVPERLAYQQSLPSLWSGCMTDGDVKGLAQGSCHVLGLKLLVGALTHLVIPAVLPRLRVVAGVSGFAPPAQRLPSNPHITATCATVRSGSE